MSFWFRGLGNGVGWKEAVISMHVPFFSKKEIDFLRNLGREEEMHKKIIILVPVFCQPSFLMENLGLWGNL